MIFRCNIFSFMCNFPLVYYHILMILSYVAAIILTERCLAKVCVNINFCNRIENTNFNCSISIFSSSSLSSRSINSLTSLLLASPNAARSYTTCRKDLNSSRDSFATSCIILFISSWSTYLVNYIQYITSRPQNTLSMPLRWTIIRYYADIVNINHFYSSNELSPTNFLTFSSSSNLEVCFNHIESRTINANFPTISKTIHMYPKIRFPLLTCSYFSNSIAQTSAKMTKTDTMMSMICTSLKELFCRYVSRA